MPTKEEVTRKLRAILSADVKGYSLLMADDEASTVRTLKSYRKVMSAQIVRHKGRVVDAPGDNLLAEFASVVDAVQCAVEIQKILKEKNDALPLNKRLEFRIGVNIGDVIQDGDSLYGEGVNIAARIEGLADPSGVCISRNAYDHISNKLNYGYEYLGEHSVKNIDRPVRVYKVLMAEEDAGKLIGEKSSPARKKWPWLAVATVAFLIGVIVWQFSYEKLPPIEAASVENMAYPLPDKPSIAVLPFDNLSGDPEQNNFCDGLTIEIISSLSKTDQLFVIAGESSFAYKDKQVKVNQIAEELSVRYILKGSTRLSEDKVRINTQLIDAVSGHHLWTERYDRDLKDIFALQDEITLNVVTSLQIELTEGEQARMWSKHIDFDVYLKMVEALSLWREDSIESHMRHGQIGKEIIKIAPESGVGYSILSWHHWWLALTLGQSPKENLAKAFELAQKALSIQEYDAWGHALLGSIYMAMRQHEKAIAAGKRSIELQPNGAMVHGLLGFTLLFAGQPDEAIGYLNKGIRLNPFPASWYFQHLGSCYLLKGQYEKALTLYKQALLRSPDTFTIHLLLAAIYAVLERQDEAEAAAKKVLELYPSFSIERFSTGLPFKNQADLKILVDALRKAGLPE